MVVGKGRKTGKEYTAVDKFKSFNEVIQAVVSEKKKIEGFKETIKDMNGAIKEAIKYWCEEYAPDGVDITEYNKEATELFKIKIDEILKEDQTVRNALELEFMMVAEAEED